MQPGSDRPAPSAPQVNGRAFCVRETFGRKQRLRHTAQFQETYDQNRRWHGRYLVLFLRAAPDASLRLGVVASKKVGNAPERARAKRRLREAFRRHRAQFTACTDDVVLVARRSILAAPWPELVAELLRLAAQAGLAPPAAK
ncbi:MAG: ribonuclease P protein component [Kiritimatiellia bacterium]